MLDLLLDDFELCRNIYTHICIWLVLKLTVNHTTEGNRHHSLALRSKFILQNKISFNLFKIEFEWLREVNACDFHLQGHLCLLHDNLKWEWLCSQHQVSNWSPLDTSWWEPPAPSQGSISPGLALGTTRVKKCTISPLSWKGGLQGCLLLKVWRAKALQLV